MKTGIKPPQRRTRKPALHTIPAIPPASETDLTIPGLVHDLNNVFQTLIDAADRLSGDPRWSDLASLILRSVERGQHITRGLAEGGGASAPFESILKNAILFVLDASNGAGEATLRFVPDVEPGIVLRHGWAWERVLINLFLNARRAMPDGGQICIRAHRVDSRIEIAVSDDGVGIPPALLDSLFEPGVSGHHSSGLGLHIVRTIVKQDGGSVRAANLEKGAEFLIALPATAAIPRRRLARASSS
jgi:signal transduction histidine kinase